MNVKIMGADASATNSNGTAWTPSKQVTTARSRLYKLSIGSTTSTTDMWVWIFDTASGTGGATDPVMCLFVPSGVGNTWDFPGDGSLFQNGIYIGLATAAPASPTDTRTAMPSNSGIVKVDYRVG